jgi:hypothetical protein
MDWLRNQLITYIFVEFGPDYTIGKDPPDYRSDTCSVDVGDEKKGYLISIPG